MGLNSVQDWIAWAGIVIPLGSLAWAAIVYVLIRKRELQHQEFLRFFEVMDHIGKAEGSIASKMASFYELRKYPEYTSVIINLCENCEVAGSPQTVAMLRKEMAETAVFLKAKDS